MSLARPIAWLTAVWLIVMLTGFAAMSGRTAPTDVASAARGLRSAAAALWIRVVAAGAVVFLTLLVGGAHGASSTLGTVRLATLVALFVNIVALTRFALAALQVGRAAIPELPRWPFALAALTSMCGAGVMVVQAPWLYKELYPSPASWVEGISTRVMQALPIALPLVIAAGVAVVGLAIARFAALRGNQALQAQAQSRTATFVTLSIVAVAIPAWILPELRSRGEVAMMSLVAAAAGFSALIAIAKVLGGAADELEREPGLPTATIVNDRA